MNNHVEMSDEMFAWEVAHPPAPPTYESSDQRDAWVMLWQCGIRGKDELDRASAKVVQMARATCDPTTEDPDWTREDHHARGCAYRESGYLPCTCPDIVPAQTW